MLIFRRPHALLFSLTASMALPALAAAAEKVQPLPSKTLAQIEAEKQATAEVSAKKTAKAKSTKSKASTPKVVAQKAPATPDADTIEAELTKTKPLTTPDAPAAQPTQTVDAGKIETKVLESITQSQATINSSDDAAKAASTKAAETKAPSLDTPSALRAEAPAEPSKSNDEPSHLTSLIATASALRESNAPTQNTPPSPVANATTAPAPAPIAAVQPAPAVNEIASTAPTPAPAPAQAQVLSSSPTPVAAVTTPAEGVAPASAFAPPEPESFSKRWIKLHIGLMASRWDKLDSKFPKGGLVVGATLARQLSSQTEVGIGFDVIRGANSYHGPDDVRGAYQLVASGRYYAVEGLYGNLGLALGNYRAWSVKADNGSSITYHRASSGTLAGLIPELGYSLAISKDLRAELGANYTWYAARSAAKIGGFGLQLALGFKL